MASIRAVALAAAVGVMTLTVPASPASAAGCHFKVVWSVAGVYEKPSNSSTHLKNKYAGDIVGNWCFSEYNSAEGNWYQAVSTASASDGIGWMRSQALVRVS